MSVEQVFMRATQHLADGEFRLTDQQRSAFYGLQKQAIDGNCNVNPPPKGNISARGKYDAWNAYRGMSKVDAMQKYIAALQKVDPSFQSDGTAAASSSSSSGHSSSGAVLQHRESQVVKEGTLFKQKDIFKGWRSRYFVLDDTFLHYYADKGDPVPLKSILVLGCSVTQVNSTKVGSQEYFPFVISNPKSQKTYNLSVHSEEEARAWINALQSVCKHPAPHSQYNGNIDRLLLRRPQPDAELAKKSSPLFPVRDEVTLENIPEKFMPKINKAVQAVLENANGGDEWEPLCDKEGAVCHWKPSNAGLCVKGETTLSYSLLDVFSLLVNDSRRKEYDYLVSSCKTLKKLSNNTTVEYWRHKQVWPTPVRDMCVMSHWRLLADNSVVLASFSEKWDDLCPNEEGVVRAEVILNGFVLSASSKGTKIQFVSQIDMRDMPDVVLSTTASKLPMNLVLVKQVLDRDKEAGRVAAPRLIGRGRVPKFEELLYAFEVRTSDKTSMGDAVSNFMGEAAGEGNEGSGKDSSAAPKSSTSLPATSQSVVTSTTKPSPLSTLSLFVLFIPVTLYYAVDRQYRAIAFLVGLVFAVEYVLRLHMGTPRKKSLTTGLSHVPSGHVDVNFAIDLTRLLRYLETRRDASGVEITITHIAVKAAAIAISEIPNLNGHVVNDDFYFSRKSGIDVSLSTEIFGNETVMMKVENCDVKPIDYLADEIKNRKKVISEHGVSTPKLLSLINSVLPACAARYVSQFFYYLGAKVGVSVPFLGIEAFPQGVCTVVTIPSKEKSEGDVELSLIPNRVDGGAPVCLTVGSVTLQPIFDENKNLAAQHVLNVSVSIDTKACSLAESKRFAARVQQLITSPSLLDKADRVNAMSKEDEKVAAEKAANHAAIFKRH